MRALFLLCLFTLAFPSIAEPPLTSFPLLGDESSIAEIIAKPEDFINKPVILAGAAEIASLYLGGYQDALPTHYCIRLVGFTKDMKPNGALIIYAKKITCEPLIKRIVARQKEARSLAVRLKVETNTRCFDLGNFSLCAELVDWQIYDKAAKKWEAWGCIHKPIK